MNKGVTFFVLLICISVQLFSQPYYSSFGVRIGEPVGLTAKFFFSDMVALEGMAGKGIFYTDTAGGKADVHTAIFVGGNLLYQIELGRGGLYAYFGGGPGADIGSGFMQFYVMGAVGLEYVANRAPISLFIDVIPSYAVIRNSDFQQAGSITGIGSTGGFIPRGGLGARYYF